MSEMARSARGVASMCQMLDILYAARSETSSNTWKFSVISDFRWLACFVGMPSRTFWMASRKSAKLG